MLVEESDQPYGFTPSTSTVRPKNSARSTSASGIGTGYSRSAMDLNTGRWFATVDGDRVVMVEIGEHDLSEPRLLGRHEGDDHRLAFDPRGRLVATSNGEGLIKIWEPDEAAPLMR